jgi:CheY-like chemotaxis protein
MPIQLGEENERLGEPLAEFLERENHVVTWVTVGPAALAALLDDVYDLAMLDWVLTGRDGLSIVREQRRRQLPTLLLMLTARDTLEEVIEGLRWSASTSWPRAGTTSDPFASVALIRVEHVCKRFPLPDGKGEFTVLSDPNRSVRRGRQHQIRTASGGRWLKRHRPPSHRSTSG